MFGSLPAIHFKLSVSSQYFSRRLQLNASKTEAIWFGSKSNIAKLNTMDSYI